VIFSQLLLREKGNLFAETEKSAKSQEIFQWIFKNETFLQLWGKIGSFTYLNTYA